MKARRLTTPVLIAATLAGSAFPAFAEEAASPVTGNVGFASEYRFRGIAQSDKRPAVSAGLDYAHSSGVYLGTWASSISWVNDALKATDGGGSSIEWDFYGGYKGKAGPLGYDVGGLYYFYPGNYPDGFIKPNTFELYAAATWEWFTLKYSYALTKTFGFSESKGSSYLDLTAAYPLAEGLNLIGHVGHQKIKGSESAGLGKNDCSYTDWKLGATYDYVGVTWGASAVGTNAKAVCYTNYRGTDTGSTTLVLSATKTF